MKNEIPFSIILSKEEIFLEFKYSSIPQNIIKLISININKNQINLENPKILEKKKINKKYNAKAILGIINICNSEFILFVSSSEIICKMKDEIIYKINEVDFCGIPNKKLDKSTIEEEAQILNCKEGISELLKLGFYYSFSLDLTNSQQNQLKINYDLDINYNDNYLDIFDKKLKKIYDTTNQKYFFNFNLYNKFINPETSKPFDYTYTFITPIICGFIDKLNLEINENQLDLYLITRRSKNNAGTRFNARGINDDGNAANFCETELILIYNNTLFSFTQLRGSAPIFFEKKGISYYTDITRNKDFTKEAFTRHIKEIGQDFDNICFINLLNENDLNEVSIIKEFENQIKLKKDDKKIKYLHFDLLSECGKEYYSGIDNLIKKMNQFIDFSNFFSYNLSNNMILSIQKSLPRINCLDCLNRTNLVQSIISWKILENMFKNLKFSEKDLLNIFNPNENFILEGSQFKESFKYMWDNNGNAISFQYAGTASTSTSFTTTGINNLFGYISDSINNVKRLYQVNFGDDFKQECIDILLQTKINSNEEDIPNSEINLELYSRKNEYIKYLDFYIFIGNYNLSNHNLNNFTNINDWLTSYKNNPLEINYSDELKNILPDFYILGFEEIEPNFKKNLLKEEISIILSQINDSEYPYQFMYELEQSEVYLLLFAKASCIKYIKNISYNIYKYNSCFLCFDINTSKFAISCNKLSSERNKEELFKILKELYTNLYSFFFIFGDLNIHLNLKSNEKLMLDLVKKHSIEINYDFSKYYIFDQYSQYKKENYIFGEMEEAKIKFSPTYKYKIGNTNYDITEITPSWYDRVFYKIHSKTIPLSYNKCLLTLSHHQPIYGVYKITTETIDNEKKNLVLKEIRKEKNKERYNSKNKNIMNNYDYSNIEVINNFDINFKSKLYKYFLK